MPSGPVLHNGSVDRLRLNGHGGRLEPRFGRFPFGSWNQQNIFPLLGMKQRKKRAMNLPSALRDEEHELLDNCPKPRLSHEPTAWRHSVNRRLSRAVVQHWPCCVVPGKIVTPIGESKTRLDPARSSLDNQANEGLFPFLMELRKPFSRE